MAWLTVDWDGSEAIFKDYPSRLVDEWVCGDSFENADLPKGTIEKLIGDKLTWEDEPVKI